MADRTAEYLRAFPLPRLAGLSGPISKPTAWDEHRGWYDPDPGGDYECWWVDVGDGQPVPVPLSVIEAVRAEHGFVFEVNFDPDDTVEQRTSKVEEEKTRALAALNAAAAQLAART